MADLIDSLIGYVKDIKPYHTKIFGVEVEYVTSDDINVSISEELSMVLDLGLPVCENISSLAIAVGDDDGWDTKPYDSLPYDIIQTEADGYCVSSERFYVEPFDDGWDTINFDSNQWDLVENEGDRHVPIDTYLFDGVRYYKPTGFMDYAFVSVTEDLKIEGQIVGTDVEDCHTVVNRPWDSPIDGIDVVEYGADFMKVDTDLTHIFTLIPSFQFSIINSSLNDGTYTVDTVTYDAVTNETTINIIENTLNSQIPDGFIQVGFYDAYEWDGDPVTAVEQPNADVNAKSTICESLVITDGYGWDDPSVGWDATVDDDYAAPPEEQHNPAFFDQPSQWDDAYNIIDATSSPHCDNDQGIGWEGHSFDSVPWDADNYLPGFKWDEGEWDTSPYDSGVIEALDSLAPTGVVVFSPEKMPIPNPTNIGSLFTQTVANSTWVVNHNQGYYPIVRVYSGGIEILPLSVVHTSQNQVIISFSSPQTGEARIV